MNIKNYYKKIMVVGMVLFGLTCMILPPAKVQAETKAKYGFNCLQTGGYYLYAAMAADHSVVIVACIHPDPGQEEGKAAASPVDFKDRLSDPNPAARQGEIEFTCANPEALQVQAESVTGNSGGNFGAVYKVYCAKNAAYSQNLGEITAAVTKPRAGSFDKAVDLRTTAGGGNTTTSGGNTTTTTKSNSGATPFAADSAITFGNTDDKTEHCGDPGPDAKLDSKGNPDGKDDVDLEIEIGCRGKGNPIVDMFFAITKFLSLGAGIIMVIATIISGMQFASARDNPQAKAAAIKRIYAVGGAMLLFMFAYALLNWLTPGGTF